MLYRDYGGFITLSIFDVGTEFAARNSHPDLGICFLSTDFGIPEYYQITVVGLIALLGMKEMLLVSKEEDRFSLDSMDMGIYPLIICFIASFLFASLEIIFTR
ncbi:hypothetical protein SAMN02910340_00097 [Methanosarcina thermophila]|uniref:Uncharacterized protein n=3 Tax=Methanosarcina thermophila TaxID=2210 RepID=A0A1I6X225_METTE|nr:hypothetical protein [Methanosarcina thermophila]AKB13459.1 hypothetical protein MSTHT_1701 [Methanosarcina thermophila TM-1]AKB15905.1 hypothetical protein MSTHC_1587 [Methanosarcina thermophila CHTI-55]SFT32325.1 hypothetical protein SAMN02910340_00097 [Methanosarcina thermophila]BAW28465.1 conserved hypothetical protein [Methanosarcina thermophila]GLI14461.1 hypothetical protein MTHERMMSTA1_15870 [Methanosarcina thermophila MST-A1]